MFVSTMRATIHSNGSQNKNEPQILKLMKNLICLFALSLIVSVSSISAQKAMFVSQEIAPTEAMKTAEMVSWDNTKIDLGAIPQNIPAPVEFTLTNNSDQPMVLVNVKGSCGCTATNYDSSTIEPGATSTIQATYNAKKEGKFTKTVSVTTSLSDTPMKLTLTGEVVAK